MKVGLIPGGSDVPLMSWMVLTKSALLVKWGVCSASDKMEDDIVKQELLGEDENSTQGSHQHTKDGGRRLLLVLQSPYISSGSVASFFTCPAPQDVYVFR